LLRGDAALSYAFYTLRHNSWFILNFIRCGTLAGLFLCAYAARPEGRTPADFTPEIHLVNHLVNGYFHLGGSPDDFRKGSPDKRQRNSF
jgi:hypothetical protein